MIPLIKKYLAAILLGSAIAILTGYLAYQPNFLAKVPQSIISGQSTTAIAQTDQIQLAIPIDCTLGKDCFIMHYVDRLPSPEVLDFACGTLTYAGHNGTDFAIRDETAMKAGVAVKASAPGQVLRVRDGVPDQRVVDQTTIQSVKGIECGNGAVIDHGNGWQTQYCHMRRGSVVVQPGTLVEKGTVLGMIGESGLASFPHVHLTVTYQGKNVDPFVGPTDQPGCHVAPQPIWENPIPYVPTGLVRAGFASEEPNMDRIWQGDFSLTTLPISSKLLIFWVQPYGVKQGDQEEFRLIDPNGQEIAKSSQPIPSTTRIWLRYIGKINRPQRPLIPGIWRGEYRLVRGTQVLIDLQREINLS